MSKICKLCETPHELNKENSYVKIRGNCISYRCKTHVKKKVIENYNKNKEVRNKYSKDNAYKYKEIQKKRQPKYSRTYYLKNRQKMIDKQVIKNKIKRIIDVNFKLQHNLRSRLLKAIKNNYKTGSAVRDLGCSIENFKYYIESKFQVGMSWENYGKWHLDHIKPLSKFNLNNKEEFLKACHYSNFQPLWAIDNLKKGATYVEGA